MDTFKSKYSKVELTLSRGLLTTLFGFTKKKTIYKVGVWYYQGKNLVIQTSSRMYRINASKIISLYMEETPTQSDNLVFGII